jgi:uncharacterized integral membrane protein
MSDPQLNDTSAVEPKQKRRISPRLVLGLIFLVLLVVFLAENTRKVKIRFLAPEVKAPLYLALLVAAVVGALAALLIQHRRHKR